MLSDTHKGWTGTSWQEWIERLLRLKYGHARYQSVPDAHKGDLGIEGYSLDGCAYQCYAGKLDVGIKERYEAQRNKLTEDLAKLIKNKDVLLKVLGDLKIGTYVFAVPKHDSKELNIHAQSKTDEYRKNDLPFLAKDFKVHIVTDDFFEPEKLTLLRKQGTTINVDSKPVAAPKVGEWKAANPDLVANATKKAKKIPTLATSQTQTRFTKALLEIYLKAENLLDAIRTKHPEIYEEILSTKTHRQDLLEMDTLTASLPPHATIAATTDKYAHELLGAVSGLNDMQAEVLARGAVAEWILTCPMDFIEVPNG